MPAPIFTGTLSRTPDGVRATLTHPADPEPLILTGTAEKDTPIILGGHKFMRGRIEADRRSFELWCEASTVRIFGDMKFLPDRGVYEMVETAYSVASFAALPGDVTHDTRT